MPKWIQIEIDSGDVEQPVELSDEVPGTFPWKRLWLSSSIGFLLVVVLASIWFAQPQSSRTLASGAGGSVARLGDIPAIPQTNQAQVGAPPAQLAGSSTVQGPQEAGNASVAPALGSGQQSAANLIPSNRELTEDIKRRLNSDRPVAVVNGEWITEGQLEREVGIGRVLFPLLRGVPVNDDPQTLEQMRSDLLSSLIDERLLAQAAREAGLTVSDEDLEARLSGILTRIGLTETQLGEMLAAVGVSLEDVRASLRKTMLTERFVQQNPPPEGISAGSNYEAWTKALQQTADIQILVGDAKGQMVKIGQPAPPFTLRSPTGEVISLSNFAGQPLLINFWATWCPPCRFEMPFLQAAYEKYRDQGFVVLAVDVQETPELVIPYLEENGLSFPTVLDRSGAVSAAYRVQALPTTVFVNREGRVTDIHRGALTEKRLQAYLDKIISP